MKEQPIIQVTQFRKTATPAKNCVQKILRTRNSHREFIKYLLRGKRKENT